MWDKMHKTIILLLLTIFLSQTIINAQTNVSLAPTVGARLSIGLDKKIVKGFHVSLSEEIRLDNNFCKFDRFHTTLALSYKVNPYFKFGTGYALINSYSSSNKAFKGARHRLMVDVIGSFRTGNWKFSLKERFQMTHYSGTMNEYQKARNTLMLKSRFTVKYYFSKKYSLYTYVEMRNYMNAPVIVAAYNGTNYLTTDDYSEKGETGWFLKGFNGGYINRLRGALGTEININKHNTINAYFLGDFVNDKVVDANSKGTKLKSYTRERGFVGWIGFEYEFSF
mgnify:CR=1 FL=1